MVMGSSIEEYDHKKPSNEQTLTFEITDKPSLPHSLTLMLWRQWMDDSIMTTILTLRSISLSY